MMNFILINIVQHAHIRRKFVESLEENHSLSMWFIDEIGRLFGIEHDCKKAGLTADQVLVERLQRSKPIMDPGQTH